MAGTADRPLIILGLERQDDVRFPTRPRVVG